MLTTGLALAGPASAQGIVTTNVTSIRAVNTAASRRQTPTMSRTPQRASSQGRMMASRFGGM